MIPVMLQGRGAPAHPTPRSDPDKPRGGGGGRPHKPDGGKPGASRPAARKPAHHKPADKKPAHHKPTAKKSAGRGEAEAVWLDVEFKPLAKGGHLQ